MGQCAGCGRDNRPEALFCAGCGGALAKACGSCGAELEADARFCDRCGTPVGATNTPSQAPPPPATTAVRKTVTVLFCDLVGSTSFGEQVDPETARETMGRYHEMARQAIEANGGTLAKFIGDGVMALFGVPEVGEDDALRAVRTGVELQHRFAPFGDLITQRHGVEVGLRVGINTGELVVADHDDDIVGDAVNTAARLEAECVPGRVLVGEDTWRLTRSAVQFEVLGEVSVKGKQEPIATFQVVDETSADDEMLTPFVGRDREVEALRAEFELAGAEGSARLATVIGAPGVGKTRLSRELGATVGNSGRVFEVRCERAGTATFAPIAELLQAVTDLGDDRELPEIVPAIRDALGDVDDRDRVADLLASAIGAAPGRSTEDTFFGVRRLVEELGRARPTILVIDDIQWAEPLFLDLLEHLARWVAAPVLVVGLARPELREIRPALAETGRRVSLVISLDGLDAAATAQLAAELLGTGELPAELVDRLPSSTDGNPLFVRELVRMLVDDGVIASTGAGWELTVDPEAVDVPPTIQSLLATRVERLPERERRVIELASVVGPEFPLGALVALAPGLSRGDVDDTLERLRRREQIEPTGTYWGDEPVFRFHHVLIRDAAYRRVLKGVRADQHLAVGDWMERRAASIVGDHDVAIAHHFEQAHLYRRQLGTDDAATVEVGRRAASLLGAAARAALERDDLAAASRLAGRAVECLPDDDGELADLLVVGCEASLSSGDVASGAPMLKRLGNLAIDDGRLGAWTTCFEAQLTVLTDPSGLTDAAATTAVAADTLAELGDEAGVAKARLTRASALARLGQIGDCEAELDLALAAARTADDRRRITSVLGAAPVAALWGPSPVARAGGRCLDVMRLSRITADSPAVEATSVRCQAVLEGMRGRFDTARSLLDAARTTGRKVGLRHGLLETELYAGIIELFADDPVAAEPHLREAFGGLGRLGVGADAGQAAAYLARALLLQGRLDEAEELADDGDALAGQNLQTAIAARSVLAEVLAERGETDEAIALADEAVRIAAGTDITLDHANALASLARVRLAARDSGGARRAADSARELYEAKGAVVSLDLGRGAGLDAELDAAASGGRTAVADRDEREPDKALTRENLSREVVFDDRRTLIGRTYRGLDEVGAVIDHSSGYDLRSELLESSHRLVLLSIHAETKSDLTAEDDHHVIVRFDDANRIDLMVAFDDDAVDAARSEYERLRAEMRRLGRQLLADDLVIDDRRSMFARVYVGIEESGPFTEWAGQFDITPVRQYFRRRRLWLGLMDGQARDGSGNAIRWLQIHRFNTDGQLEHMVGFDEDQLRPAIDELNRLDLEMSDGRRRAMLSAMYDAVAFGDAKSFEPKGILHHPDVVWTDHRHMAINSNGLADIIERNRLLHELIPDLHLFVGNVGRIEPPFVAETIAFRGTTVEGADIDDGYAAVFELDVPTGLWARADLYEATDIETANRRVAELAADETRLPRFNDAVYAGGWANSAAYAGDRDRFVERLHPEFSATLLDGRIVDRHAIATGDVAPIDVGFGAADRTLLAIRDDRLALIEITERIDDVRHRRFAVEEISDDGLVVASTQFAGDSCEIALSHLDARWLEICGDDELAELRARLVRTTASVRRPDSDDFSALVSPDWHAVDHRSLGLLSMDAESRYEVHVSMDEDAARGQVSEKIHPADVLRITPDGWVVSSVRRTLNEHGDEFVRTWLGAVEIDPDSDQHRSVHLFDPTDVDAAIARLESLATPPIAADHEPWNTADRLVHEAYASHDWESRVADTVAIEDRRAIVGTSASGRDELMEGFGGIDSFETTVTTSATRRDDLALVSVAAQGKRFEWDWLAIYQFDDELCFRIVSFDPDDLAEAVDELNRLAMETKDVETLVLNAQLSLQPSAVTAGDARRIGLLYTPSASWVDRRRIGYGVNDVHDLERRTRVTDDMTDGWVTRVVRDLRHDFSAGLTTIAVVGESGSTSDGATVDTAYVAVGRGDSATGLTTDMEQFEVDEVDAAHARFGEWVEERTWRPSNDAVLLGGLVNVFIRAELVDDAIGRLADRFTAALADDSIVSKDDVVADVALLGALGFGVAERTVLAVRGTRFALIESVSESDPHDRRLVVHEIDHEAHIKRLAVFPPKDLRAALDVLGEWSRPAGLTADTLGVRWERALLDLDADTVAELTSDDFEVVDHHPLSLLNMSRDEFLELQRRADPDGAGFDFAACIHRSSDHGFVTSNSVNSPFSANGTGHEHPLVVGLFRNGKVWRQESYPQDRLDDAIARYEQHVREVTGDDANHDGPTNRADRLQRARLDADGVSAAVVQTLAVRGDDLALHYVDTDDPRVDLTQWDDDGQLLDHLTYTPDQFDHALAELDDRHMQRLHPVDAARLTFIAGFWRALAKGDLGEYAPRAAYDVVDHRTLGWASDHSVDDRLLAGVGDLTWVDQIHHLDDGLVCNTRTTVRGGLGSVLTQRQINLIDHVSRNGRRRTEFFDVDDLDAALERRRQWMTERADQPVASNDAFIVDQLADDVARNLPLERFLTLLASDFEATLADGRTIDRADLEAGRATPADLGYGSGVRDLFATRFDDLAVIEITSEDGVTSWVVLETHDRLLTGLSVFDERGDAGVSLDLSSARLSGVVATTGLRTMITFGRCLMNSDADGAIGMLAPDFVMVDHRPIGLGTMDNEAYAASIRSAMSLGSTTITRSLRLADGTALSISRNYYPGAGSGQDYVDTATVVAGDDAHVTRIEHFDPDDMASAVARFHELAADAAAP